MTYEFLPIPPGETATDPIHSPADLRQRWRALMGPLGFGERLLRYVFIDPDRCMLKVLHDMPIGTSPAPGTVDDLMSMLAAVVSQLCDGFTVAFLLSRPGGGGVSNADKRWASALTDAAERFAVPIEPIFRANDDAIVLISRQLSAVRPR